MPALEKRGKLSPSSKRITMYAVSLNSKTECTRTMFGWSKRASVRASR